jgi:hypothetical protein
MELLASARPASLDPPAAPPRRSQDIAAAMDASAGSQASRRSPRIRPRRSVPRAVPAAGLALTAAAAAVAVLLGSGPGGVVQRATRPHSGRGPRVTLTAAQVLLAAAAHVVSAPATGRYWRVREMSGVTFPAGTRAVPYDISLATSFDQWNPRSAGRKEWVISRRPGARPSTPADAAAWRAAGSPARWHSGQPAYRSDSWLAGYPFEWVNGLDATTAASARSATWQVSDGTVGYVEGDEPGLKAAQFRAMPAQPALVEARLRHYARLTLCGRHPSGDCSTVNQIVWSEALALLQDPVSAQVRSATFRVMAALPGVRLLGAMTDPLGRHGYGLAAGAQDPSSGPFHPTKVVVIDPRTGSLLATEDIGPMPRSLACLSFDEVNRNPQSRALAGKPVKPGERLPRPKDVITRCTGSVYHGRSYQRQVDEYVALISEGWTNASPVLPPSSRWQGPSGFPGLPPAP